MSMAASPPAGSEVCREDTRGTPTHVYVSALGWAGKQREARGGARGLGLSLPPAPAP